MVRFAFFEGLGVPGARVVGIVVAGAGLQGVVEGDARSLYTVVGQGGTSSFVDLRVGVTGGFCFGDVVVLAYLPGVTSETGPEI